MTTYIALDWAQANMAIAFTTGKSSDIKLLDIPACLKELKLFLDQFKGKKKLVFEETTTAQWLYTELRPLVDELFVCDPYRNKLLSDGAKTDKIDAKKLLQLYKADLLKPVYHGGEVLLNVRKLVSSYNDVIQRGVRLKNQRKAIYRAQGKSLKDEISGENEKFILAGIEEAIRSYETERKRYVAEFEKTIKRHKILGYLRQIPGVGAIGAVKLGAIIVTADRFKHKNNFLSYCGLVRLDKLSGGRSYGSKKPRYNREIKSVFKTAALVAITQENCFTKYYNYLRQEKRYADYNARHAVARKIAEATLGVLRTKTKFEPNRLGAIRMTA